MNVIIGKKIGMTSYFGPTGREFGATVIQVGPCNVVDTKTLEKDGYEAVVLGFLDRKESKFNKPELGLFKKSGVTPKRVLKEFRFEGAGKEEIGQSVTAESFVAGDVVIVTGMSKGKGFQGVVKKYGFKMQRQSHGGHESKRGPGSIGQCTWPSRVMKGKKMAGRMGNEQITIKNIEVLKVDKENNLMLVLGSIPGARNGIVRIKKSEGGK